MQIDPERWMLRHATPPPESETENFFKWINYQLNVPMEECLKWYFVTAVWLKKFKHWAKNRPLRSNVLEPGPIDITGLRPLDDLPEDETHLNRVSEHLWNFIFKRYGILDNRRPVWRYRVGPQVGAKCIMIERKLQRCTFYRWDEMGKPRRWKFSLYDNLKAFKEHIRNCFNVSKDVPMRIWMLWDEGLDIWDVFYDCITRIALMYEHIRTPWKNTYKVEFFQDGCFPLSKPWPFLPGTSINGLLTTFKDIHPDAPRLPLGMIRIYYGSSDSYFVNAIVVLAHIPSIRNYFTSDMYKRELNPENPMGHKGEFAERIADIVKYMWPYNDETPSISFGRFTVMLKKANTMYEELENSDIMPFMQYLLDCLHEDCNRVKEKPKLERPDSGQRPAADVAAEFWDHFKKSNDSLFLDTCYGLVHNSSRCHGCNLSTNTFEALSGITLPMPHTNNAFKVVFRFQDHNKPLLITRLRLSSSFSVETVHKKISEVFGVKPFTFSLMYTATSGFRDVVSYRQDHEPFRQDQSSENYLLALEHPPEWKGGLLLKDYKKKLQVRPVVLEFPWLPHRQAWTLGQVDEVCTFKVPYLVMCSMDCTYADWVDILEEKFEDIFPRPAEGDEWWHWKSPEDDEYEARVKKYHKLSRKILPEPPLENEDNIWEKNGRHYYFRIKLNNWKAPNDDDRLITTNGEFSIHMEPHKLYARKYLEHLMDFKPNVKVMGDWWLINPHTGFFPLEETLEAWGQEQSMGLNNRKKCVTCGKYKPHTDRTGFWHLPNYLFMNVHRFIVNYNDRINGGIRNDAVVAIPEKGLDLGPYVTGPLAEGEETMYDLHSVTMHIGCSILRSTYISWIKYEGDGQFYRFDGDFFPSYPEEFMTHHGNYFFCYKRRGIEDFTFPAPEGGMTKPDTLDKPNKNSPGPSLFRGPDGLMIIDDMFRMEKPNMIASDLVLDAGILKLKTQGIDTKNLESVRSHRKAMKDRDLGGASSSCFSRAPMKCVLDSDSDEETGKFGAKGKGYYSYRGKEKE